MEGLDFTKKRLEDILQDVDLGYQIDPTNENIQIIKDNDRAYRCHLLSLKYRNKGNYKLSAGYSNIVLESIFNENDHSYMNWQFGSYALYNIILYTNMVGENIIEYIDGTYLQYLKRKYDILTFADAILTNKFKNYVPNRRMFIFMAKEYEKLTNINIYVSPMYEAFYNENKKNICESAIKYYKKAIETKDKPDSWFDDALYYEDENFIEKCETKIKEIEKIMGKKEEKKDSTAEQKLMDIINSSYDEQSQDTKKNKICVYAISKNEAKFVDRWIKSMSEADSIVVLDTGSTDGTVELLSKYENIFVTQGAFEPWRFDTARNVALGMVPDECNILVSTDLDEVFDKGWADVLRKKWKQGVHKRAVYKYAWSHDENQNPLRIFRYDKIHSRDWTWKYPCHELLWDKNKNTEKYDVSEVCNLFDEVFLHHYPDKEKSRSNYMELLELRAKEDPNDVYGLIYLAHEYSYRKLYNKANKLFEFILSEHGDFYDEIHDSYNNLLNSSCYLFMGDNYFRLSNKEKAIECYQKAIQIEPSYREPYINLAKVYMEDELYEKAIETLNDGVLKTYRHYSWLERDNSWSWEIFDLLSSCYYYKKEPDLVVSSTYAQKAFTYKPNDERLKKNLEITLSFLRNDIELVKTVSKNKDISTKN